VNIEDLKTGEKYLYGWGTGCFSILIITKITEDMVYGVIGRDEDEKGKRRDYAGGTQMELNRIECERYIIRKI
jgi:hypothetical protein